MTPTPVIPDWVKLLNQYDTSHYIPGKKVTAEEWNALFLATTEQGNYNAETLDLLINNYLPDTFYTKTAMDASLNLKVDKITGKGLSENDYTNTEKNKVDTSYSLRHSHTNKSLLDTYNQLNSDLTDAVIKKHNHSNKLILDTITENVGTVYTRDTGISAGNVPVLNQNGKLPDSVIPATAITDTYVVNSEAEMLALDAQKGDIAVRTDENKTYSLQDVPASNLAHWVLLRTPTDVVLSVNGQIGNIILDYDDVGAEAAGVAATLLAQHTSNLENPHQVTKAQVALGNVDNTSDIDKPVSTAQQNALNLKTNITDIVDNLLSESIVAPLSAKQGKVLKDTITNFNYDDLNNIPNSARIQQIDMEAVLEGNKIKAYLVDDLVDFVFENTNFYKFHITLPVTLLTLDLPNNYTIELYDKPIAQAASANEIQLNNIFHQSSLTSASVGDMCSLQNYNINTGVEWTFNGRYSQYVENTITKRIVYTSDVVRETNPAMSGNDLYTAVVNNTLKTGTSVFCLSNYANGTVSYTAGVMYKIVGEIIGGDLITDAIALSDPTKEEISHKTNVVNSETPTATNYVGEVGLVNYTEDNFVSFSKDIELTAEQKARARSNIGAGSSTITLYTALGQNSDGAVTQKVTTDNLNIITNKIPAAASSTNQLADKAFVNSSINALAAFYITGDASGNAFSTKASLIAGPWYYQGAIRVPTENDYAIVSADETKNNACTRYSYDGAQWDFQYIVNDTPFTQAQINAINSGITSSLVTQIGTNQTAIGTKQNTLVSGTNIKTINSAELLGSGNLTLATLGIEPAFTKNTAFNKNFETSTTNIKMNGTVSVGSSSNIARADHVHPKDTTKANVATTLSGYGITDAYTKTQIDSKIVRYDTTQSLNDTQKSTARSNIGATKSVTSTLTLTTAGWSSNTQKVLATIDTTKLNTIVPDIGTNSTNWANFGINATIEESTGITFTCAIVPTTALTFKIVSEVLN